MATDRDSAPTRTDVYTDLFDALAGARNAEHAGRMAAALLRKDRGGKQLVGLVDGGERAVFYSPAGRTLTAYTFDKHGVSEAEMDTLWRLLGDAASWVDAHADELDWVHPHLRWVLDAGDASSWGYTAEY